MSDRLFELALIFSKLGLLSFGGSASVLPEMEKEFVTREWISGAEFTQAVSLGFLTPGPSTLMVIPMGYQIAGMPGALVALLAYWGPTVLVAVFVTLLWSRLSNSPWPKAFRTALIPLAIGLNAGAVWVLGRSSLIDIPTVLVAGVTALILLRTKIGAPFVMFGAAIAGGLLLHP
jgi:chromate transporter